MKISCIFIIFSIISCAFSQNATKEFSYNDSIFLKDQTKSIDFKYDTGFLTEENNNLIIDSLYNFLVITPQLKIELGSYTSCKGDDNYNLKLSKKRATLLVEKLIEKGINNDRLIAVGYGEKDCDKISEFESVKTVVIILEVEH